MRSGRGGSLPWRGGKENKDDLETSDGLVFGDNGDGGVWYPVYALQATRLGRRYRYEADMLNGSGRIRLVDCGGAGDPEGGTIRGVGFLSTSTDLMV